MLDEEGERGFSMNVTKRKALTRIVIGRYDLSMPPQYLRRQGDGANSAFSVPSVVKIPSNAGDGSPPCCSFVTYSESPARRGKQGG